ncbi:spore coat polysaccharide biosynthesis protein SpsF [Salinimicrobium catena]|uniref:Spore coat polysaccharide biosynthesis protein SpsF n=1 Tax=Salinimicrobium catena TaxID=390640 RepID=A0A1H5PEB8_9FLAO|nr:glycosyltransferase family protein [Salinimicrobium catena]SDL81063.1 spore coat polysaccharide biosynthesis protein SpsF [Salinimicrobium catena]SEF12116.1 spore coat polysaccharide biosynthesis protein SpsF [Salinimicrobium catena]
MADIKVNIITQARIGSSRFPEKVLQKVNGHTMLGLHLYRLKRSRYGDNITVATTKEEGVEQIINIADFMNVRVYQGSTTDVLDRFYKAASGFNPNPDYVVRVTSDCPLIDPTLIDDVVEMTVANDLDYGSNVLKQEFPDGQDIEVFKFSALEKAWKGARLNSDREHVTPFIRKNSSYFNEEMFRSDNYAVPGNYSDIRMTVDEPVDLETIRILLKALGPDENWKTYTRYIVENSSQFSNQNIQRNEGYIKSLLND